MEETYGIQIAFVDWFLIGLPLAIVLLPTGWFIDPRISGGYPGVSRGLIGDQDHEK